MAAGRVPVSEFELKSKVLRRGREMTEGMFPEILFPLSRSTRREGREKTAEGMLPDN